MSNLENVLKEYDLHSTEGARGLKNLAKLVRLLGHKDFQSYGMFENGAAAGDILTFLEENPGAIEALYNWVDENYSDELGALVDEEEDDEEEDLEYSEDHYNKFVEDMNEAGLQVRRYQGRGSYEGPAVTVDDIQTAIKATEVQCRWDNMGLQYVVYPKY
jgi:hypothetical protein